MDLNNTFRSGFVAVIGRPNVGKSTLINRLLGQKIAAVSPRPQTTRRRQLGILTRVDAQIIFTDTPGIHQPIHKLGDYMNQAAMDALKNADLILWLVDASVDPAPEDQLISEKLKKVKHLPEIILAMNKIDKAETKAQGDTRSDYQSLYPTAKLIKISAIRGDGLDKLLDQIISALPVASPLYDPDTITDLFERDIAADLIREAALIELREEIPHGLAVRIEEYKERSETLTYVLATLLVEKESHKAIVIGKDGSMLKKIGSRARAEIESMTGRKIYLELRVKVLKNWRDSEQILQTLGYKPEPEK